MTRPSAAARTIVLTTARTILTTWALDDATDLARLHSDPETMRYVRNGRPETLEDVQALVQGYLAEQERGWAKWRLTDSAGALIGRAGFGGTDNARGLSYLIDRRLWGQGLATEVALALVQWHRNQAPRAELHALVEVGNDASVRVLEKAGFTLTGPEDYAGVPCWRYELIDL